MARTLGPGRIPSAVHEVGELHELHSNLADITSPVRERHGQLVVISGGIAMGRLSPVLQSGSTDVRGFCMGYLKGLAGDNWQGGQQRLSVEVWSAECVAGSLSPLDLDHASSRPISVCNDGKVVNAARHEVTTSHDGADLLEKMLSKVRKDFSFVVIGVDLRRYVPECGCSFLCSSLWIDFATKELVEDGASVRSLRDVLAHGGAGVNTFVGAVPDAVELQPHPLTSLLAPLLSQKSALALAVVGYREGVADPAVRKARDLATLLIQQLPETCVCRHAETVSMREGFVKSGADSQSSVTESFSLFSGAITELRELPRSPMGEFLRGDIFVRACGFPGRHLPSLSPYMSRFEITPSDWVCLVEAAETEIMECEERGWVKVPSCTWAPARLFVQLPDSYDLPAEILTTTTVRSYARRQNPLDPMVRTIQRIRGDASQAIALLPICATHPFNPVRLLRLGGVHSLLNLLSDSSALAPGHDMIVPALETLSAAEIAALVLAALAVFAPIRKFLVSQNIFELLAVAIRHPATDRHALIFTALLTRLCHDPEGRRSAVDVVSPALLQQIPKYLGSSTVMAEAALAAAASLAPFLPVHAFLPVVRSTAGHLSESAPEAFHHFAFCLAASVQRSEHLDLNAFVPRLLSLVPPEPPGTVCFRGGAAALLALCSHTSATTSLSRRWASATGAAVVRRTLQGHSGLTSIHVSIPLAEQDNDDTARASEEDATAQTHAGFQRRLTGHNRLLKLADIRGSPNSALFHERQQLRIGLSAPTELFISLALLPGTHCHPPAAACGCDDAGDGCGGQLGLWICEMPLPADGETLCHQLDLRQPLHATAAASGRTEHAIVLTLPRGTFTLVPFSTHVLPPDAAGAARTRCRLLGCGCVDLNLAQQSCWTRSSLYAACSVWAESSSMTVSEVLPFHLRLAIESLLLPQSIPLWCVAPDGPTELLICLCCQDGESLQGSEVHLDLWPAVPHRRVRNERTGALRIYVPELGHGEKIRLTCLWQEDVDVEQWTRPPPRLLLYSSAALRVHAPVPRVRSLTALCSAPADCVGRWQATALLSGSWTPGFSGGMGSLRNPQVIVDVPRYPGKGEELHLMVYLSVPCQGARPSCAITVFGRQEKIDAGRERLLEGQLRKELGSSKTALGSYVDASLVLSGAEARQPLFVVLQNTAPQELRPWQLRILARIRPREGTEGTTSSLQTNDTQADFAEAPDEPPIRCAVVGGAAGASRIYACWPEQTFAQYVPKPSREVALGERVLAWIPSRRVWSKRELLHLVTTLGPLPREGATESVEPWPEPELQPPPPEDYGLATPRPVKLLGQDFRLASGRITTQVASSSDSAPQVALCGPVEERQNLRLNEGHVAAELIVPGPRSLPRPPTFPDNSRRGDETARGRAIQSSLRCASEPRGGRLVAPQAREPSEVANAAEPHLNFGAAKERRTRMEALWRRRRQMAAVGLDSSEQASGRSRGKEASSQPPPCGRVRTHCRRRTPELYEHGSRGSSPSMHFRRTHSWIESDQYEHFAESTEKPVCRLPRLDNGVCHRRTPKYDMAPDSTPRPLGQPVILGDGLMPKHVVRLERKPGAERLGFGNVAAGSKDSPVLVVSWIKDGALAAWNAQARDLVVPAQSAIIAVNGISGDVQRMREQLREPVVELEIVTPDCGQWNRMVCSR